MNFILSDEVEEYLPSPLPYKVVGVKHDIVSDKKIIEINSLEELRDLVIQAQTVGDYTIVGFGKERNFIRTEDW